MLTLAAIVEGEVTAAWSNLYVNSNGLITFNTGKAPSYSS